MSATPFHEVESKFAAEDSTQVPDLTRLDKVEALSQPRVHQLSAIYYDTEDLRLTRAKVTLRRRTGGPDDGWHLKLPADNGRMEIHATLTEPVDGAYIIPEALMHQIRSIVREFPLSPIAQVDNHRTETTLIDAEGTDLAEFCDDRVTAWSLLVGGSKTTWREWEVELSEALSQDSEAAAVFLGEATRLLVSAGARVSSSPSKLAAALGDSINNAPLPDHLRDPGVDEDSAAAGVLEALRANRDKLVAYDPKVRRDEWDSVHQMRVATRELRSHLETFDGVLGGEEVTRLRRELKELAAILGVARDAEVVEERFLILLDAEDSDQVDEVAREHLRADMGTEYRRAHRHVLRALNSAEYVKMLNRLDALLANPPLVVFNTAENATAIQASVATVEKQKPEKQKDTGSTVVLREHLDEAYHKLIRRHKLAVSNWDNTELSLRQREDYFHDMRKAAKKLRYAAEAVGSATPLKTKRLYKACKNLQSSLGDFQDSVTSRDKLVHLAQAAHRRGENTFAYGLLYQRERILGLKALEEYRAGVRAIKSAYRGIR